MGLLSDRRLGATADWVRQRTGRSVVAQARSSAVRVGRVERTLAFDLNIPRGVWLQGTGADTYVEFDQRGWLQFHSPNDTVDINKTPWARKHAIGLDVDAAATCDCCLEDATFSVILRPGEPIGFAFNPVTCTLVLYLPCDPCGEGVGPG